MSWYVDFCTHLPPMTTEETRSNKRNCGPQIILLTWLPDYVLKIQNLDKTGQTQLKWLTTHAILPSWEISDTVFYCTHSFMWCYKRLKLHIYKSEFLVHNDESKFHLYKSKKNKYVHVSHYRRPLAHSAVWTCPLQRMTGSHYRMRLAILGAFLIFNKSHEKTKTTKASSATKTWSILLCHRLLLLSKNIENTLVSLNVTSGNMLFHCN